MFAVEGYTKQAIASICDTTFGTVVSVVARARTAGDPRAKKRREHRRQSADEVGDNS